MTGWRDTALPCYDPDCAGVAEPEQDGRHRYHVCVTCGYAFNYEPVADDTCPTGAVRQPAAPASPLLQIGRRHANPA